MGATLTIIRRPVKHARLRVREDATVQLIVPHGFGPELIDRILSKKADWIARHQQTFRSRAAAQPALAADEILLFDTVYRFIHIPMLQRRVEIDHAARQIRSGLDLSVKTVRHRWCRKHAAAYLTTRIAELSAAHRLPFKRLFIRSQRTKWGTCSASKNISLNWRLIQTPAHVIDYVILHELVHTKIMNHSHSFWVHLRAICPRHQPALAWLQSNRNLHT